jgi:hypothetical protein
VNDLPGDRVGQGDVGADIEAQPDVSPLRGRGPAGIDNEQLGSVADALEQVVEEDRVGIARV